MWSQWIISSITEPIRISLGGLLLFHNVAPVQDALFHSCSFLLQVIRDTSFVIRKYLRWWRELFISHMSSKTAMFSTHSHITSTEPWMQVLSVSTHSEHTLHNHTGPAGCYSSTGGAGKCESPAPVSVDLTSFMCVVIREIAILCQSQLKGHKLYYQYYGNVCVDVHL